MLKSAEIVTRCWSQEAAVLICPRCQADTLHQGKVVVYDRAEDGAGVVRTEIDGSSVMVDAAASNDGNPSARREGLAINFWCEGCGEAPLQLTIAQHEGSTEIGWRFDDLVTP